MFQSVIGIYPFIVDSEGTSSDAPLVFSSWMRSELSREYIEDLLADPPTFSEGGECEIVGVHFSES